MPEPKEVDFSLIFPPNMDHDYLEGREQLDFSATEAGSFSLAKAWWLAEFSLLVYEHPGFIRWVLRHIGAENYRFVNRGTTQMAIFTLGRNAFVAFRGTEVKSLKAVPDLISDVHFVMTDFFGKGMVHKGFKLAFMEVLEGEHALPELLEGLFSRGLVDTVYFTGHSLGGALAILATAWYGARSADVYTFGSPRVGNAAFCDSFPVKAWRFVNVGDLVPYLPPNLPGLNHDDREFRQLGVCMYIDQDREIRPGAPAAPETLPDILSSNVKSLVSIARQLVRNLFLGRAPKNPTTAVRAANIDAHAPILYGTYIWNWLVKHDMSRHGSLSAELESLASASKKES